DHGASIYFHHSCNNPQESAKTSFSLIKDHVLLPFATKLEEVDKEFKALLTKDVLQEIVNLIPEEWLLWEGDDLTPQDIKNTYFEFLSTRLDNSEIFVKQAQDAKETLI